MVFFYSSIFMIVDAFSVTIYDNAHFISCFLWSKITTDLSVKQVKHRKDFRQDSERQLKGK